MLDKTLVKVFCNIGVPLLFRCSSLPFKCCDFKVLECSINKKFLSKQSSVKHLFTSFAFVMKQSFRTMILKWSHHACWFLNWTQHRLLILQSDLVSDQNPDHLYRHEEQNDLGFLLTLKDPFISESCIEIKIELNFYFHTSL